MKTILPILENADNPAALEKMYRENPDDFANSFVEIYPQHLGSPILQAWYERLNYPTNSEKTTTTQPSNPKKLLAIAVGLSLLAGISARLLLHLAMQELIAPATLVFAIAPFMAAYFVVGNPPGRRLISTIALLFIFIAGAMFLHPVNSSDGAMLANLHLPVVAWVLIGFAYTGKAYMDRVTRLDFLKFNGEFAILFAAMAISGILLTGLTLQMFSLLGLDIAEFYFQNVVIIGAAGLAVFSAYLVQGQVTIARNIAPLIAKIFSPVVLVTLTVYLATVAIVGKNPFLDRDFLLSFNAVLMGVLAITIFSITERKEGETFGVFDWIDLALIVLATATDLVALSAIVFRLSAYGLTPNRIAVLGLNLVIIVHAFLILIAYYRFSSKKAGISSVQSAVTSYLPIYGAWAAIVVVFFPVLFP